MKITNVKAMVAKVMAIGILAGAFAVIAPVKAQAQAFRVGVEIGPRYDVYHHDRFDHIRAEEFRRHEEFVRRQEWARVHQYGGYRHDAPYRFR